MKVYILYCDGFLISRCTAPRLCFSQYSTGDIFFPSVKSLLICCLIFLQKISIFQIFFFNLLWKECLQNLCPFKKSKMPWCPFEYFGVLLKDNREKIKIKYFQLLWVHKRLPIIAEFFNWQISICSFLLKFHLLWQLLVSTNSISQCVSYYFRLWIVKMWATAAALLTCCSAALN